MLRRQGDGALAIPALDRGRYRYTTVSREDVWACAVNWFVKPDGYVCCNMADPDVVRPPNHVGRFRGRERQYYLHRLVHAHRESPENPHRASFVGITIDHKDRNTLLNTRRNLRPAARGLQNRNQTRAPYPGVNWVEDKQRFMVRVKTEGKTHHVGSFRHLNQALRARERKLRKLGLPTDAQVRAAANE